MNANPCTAVAGDLAQLSADKWHIVAEKPMSGVGDWFYFFPETQVPRFRRSRDQGAIITTQRRDRRDDGAVFSFSWPSCPPLLLGNIDD